MGSPMQHSTQHEVVGTCNGIRMTSFSVEWGLCRPANTIFKEVKRGLDLLNSEELVYCFVFGGTHNTLTRQDFGVGKMTSMSCRRGEDARDFYLFSRKRNSFFLSTTTGDYERLNNVGRVQASDRIRCRLQLCVKRVRLLRNLGPKFRFHKHASDGKEGKEGTWKGRFRLLISIPIVIIVLILFSALFLVSIRQILCNPGYSLLPGSFPLR